MVEALLEVRVLHRADAEAAEAGGADRLMLVALGEHRAHAPDPGAVADVVRASDLPVRVLLRLPTDANGGDTTTGAGLVRMVGLAGDYVSAGAEGVVAGFITDQLEVDVELATALGEQLPCPWTFSRAIDLTLE
ncbi:MAG: copper homeostasis protein CutC, partial [Actinomycetota bacterium]|nr:copper homeostasis protein CutC [Actinomycetota bacterium]